MKTDRIAILWPTFESYHVARFRTLYQKLGDRVIGIEFVGGAGDDGTGLGRTQGNEGLPILTLYPSVHMGTINRHELGKKIIQKIKESNIETIFVNGYSTPELRQVIFWARQNKKCCFTFFETKKDDFPRVFWKEWVKRWILKKVDGALCGGELHRQYAIELGIPASKAVIGYDVVDNDFFKRGAEDARKNELVFREKYRLPKEYFLTVCRFVEKKNLFGLLEAYKNYRDKAAEAAWDLVLCGSGSLEKSLRGKVAQDRIGGVFFAGPKKGEELAHHYSLASAFILASTTEQWGLVINEAMAAGVPVLATKVAGAASELIIEGKTGYILDPRNIQDIAERMTQMTRLSESDRVSMGRAGRELLCQKFPLDLFRDATMTLIDEKTNL